MNSLTVEAHGRTTVSFDVGDHRVHEHIYPLVGYVTELLVEGKEQHLVVRADAFELVANYREELKHE